MRSAVRALGVLMSATAIGLAVPASAASPTPAPSGAAGSAGTQTAAQDVVTFGVQPAGPKGPDARSWLYYSVTPGALLTDWVAIQNYSNRPITLDVYPADASTNSTGEFTLSQQHAALADAGSWITLDLRSSKVTVPPRNADGAGHVLVRLSMKVPMNAAPGDHGAGVIASLEGIGKNAQGDIIHFNQRVATRVYVRVSGPLHPALSVEGLHATYQGTLNPVGKGVMHLHYVVKNTGNVKLGGRQLVHIQGWWPFGLDYKGLADIPLMLPGGSVAVDATVRGVLPAFLEHVSVDITPLQLASDANPYIPVQKAATYAWAVPWAAIAVVIALVVLGWLAWRARRRPSKGRRARHGSGRGPDDLDPAERVEAVTAS